MPLFRRPKYDLIISAARYNEAGQVEWVRAFERRGPTWSDRTMIRRDALIDRIRAGERAVTGERVPLQAGTFNTGVEVRIEEQNGHPVLVAGAGSSQGDSLDHVPRV